MGGLGKYMPITYITMLIGSLALAGIPPFAGFFSKDMILEAAELVHHLGLPGGGFAVFTVYTSVIVTAIYSFRLIFMTFHGEERFRHAAHDNHHAHDDHHHAVEPKESPWVVTLPLILMAIPSAIIGGLTISDFVNNSVLSGAVVNASWFVSHLQEEILPLTMVMESFGHLPVYLALSGIIIAWLFHRNPKWSDSLVKAIRPVYNILLKNYYMDDLYIKFFAPIFRGLGRFLWTLGDMFLIDGLIVNGSAKVVNWYSKVLRKVQGGYVNTYATFMILGIIVLLTFCTRLIFA